MTEEERINSIENALDLQNKTLEMQLKINRVLMERIQKLEQMVYQNGWESK